MTTLSSLDAPPPMPLSPQNELDGPTFDERERWARELERERLQMQALDSARRFPGPGATDGTDAGKPDTLDGGMQDLQKQALAIVPEIEAVVPIVAARPALWGTLPESFMVLFTTKIWKDSKIKSAANKIKSVIRSPAAQFIPGPLRKTADNVVTLAENVLMVEWIVIAFIVMLGFALLTLAIVGVVCYANPVSCAASVLPIPGL